jgi:hypothetical protein
MPAEQGAKLPITRLCRNSPSRIIEGMFLLLEFLMLRG